MLLLYLHLIIMKRVDICTYNDSLLKSDPKNVLD